MRAYTYFFVLVCLVSLMSVGFAQEAVSSSEGSASVGDANDANQTSALSFPYLAEITDDNVNVRSGPGTNYYFCGKLNRADKVKVVGSQFSWSRIVPPPKSFSWISKQYISTDPNDPNVGIITGEAVRVYAGSEELEPIRSTTLQLKLNRGDRVGLLGEEKGDYCKIVSPDGAYLWVNTPYTKPLGPIGAGEVPMLAGTKPNVGTPAVVPATASVESKKLEEYYAIKKQFDAERAKPLDQQNYADLKKAFTEIANDKEAGKAGRYSEHAIKHIEGCELALAVAKEVPLQDAQLNEVEQRIENARTEKLAEIPDIGRFAAIGRFQTSNIYGPERELKHYKIIDNSGKIACYAVPASSAAAVDFIQFIGRKVGLVGTIEPHPQTGKALVRFTEVIELQ